MLIAPATQERRVNDFAVSRDWVREGRAPVDLQSKDVLDDGAARESADAEAVDELPSGTALMHGQYVIERFLAAGGFGITYLARDSLDRRVVIKECFPGAFCRRSGIVVRARSRAHSNQLRSIVRLFLREAHTLAQMDHPGIVGVHHVFEENDTAYMALDYVDGDDLQFIIETDRERLTPDAVVELTRRLLDAVGYVHERGMLHRDVSPDNILLRSDGSPVLIDFGAAREQAAATGPERRPATALRVVKDGYSPHEFYVGGGEHGPSSDLYALAASLYHLISGELPVDGQTRLGAVAARQPDPYRPLKGRIEGYGDAFLKTIDKGMGLLPNDRFPGAQDWLNQLGVPAAKGAAAAPPRPVRWQPAAIAAAVAAAALAGVGWLTVGGGLTASATLEEAPTFVGTAAVAPTPLADDPAVRDGEWSDAPVALTPPAPIAEPDAAVPIPEEDVARREPPASSAPARPIDAPDEPASDLAAASVSDAPAAPLGPVLSTPAAEGPDDVSDAVDVPPDSGPADAAGAESATASAAPEAEGAFDAPFDASFDVPGMATAWTVALPDGVGFGGEGGADGSILSVDGEAVSDRAAFDAVLRGRDAPDRAEDTIALNVRLRTSNGSVRAARWELPVVQNTVLTNGLSFSARAEDDGAWVTRVTRVPTALSGEMNSGDVVLGNAATSERADDRTALPRIVAEAAAGGERVLSLAVRRADGEVYAVAVPFRPEALSQ